MTRRRHVLQLDEKPAAADVAVVVAGLRAFNERQRGKRRTPEKEFAVYVRDGDGAIVGGLVGVTHLDWLYVDKLWLDEAVRGNGWGRRLMEEAERVAVRRGCLGAWLDTMSFQAPRFYRHLGYREFGELADLSGGATRFWFWKRLARRQPKRTPARRR
jgi:ribosomal protein S18 acetylase RimI-like enzyme